MKTRIKYFLVGLSVASTLCISTVDAKWVSGDDGKPKWVKKISESKSSSQSSASSSSSDSTKAAPNTASINRTRQQVLMLDDLYKTAVVAITEHYVKDPSTLSAASAAKALFAAMKAKGWHDARLLGFTDVLFNAGENAPKDAFERTAKEKILAGAANYEAVETQNGKQVFRMATSVPVVMEKCVMCHADYEGKKGAIGAISYSLPLID